MNATEAAAANCQLLYEHLMEQQADPALCIAIRADGTRLIMWTALNSAEEVLDVLSSAAIAMVGDDYDIQKGSKK